MFVVFFNSILYFIMLVIVYWYENQLVLKKNNYLYNIYFQYPFTLIGIIHLIKWFAVQIMGPTCSLTWRVYNDFDVQVLQLSPSIIYTLYI